MQNVIYRFKFIKIIENFIVNRALTLSKVRDRINIIYYSTICEPWYLASRSIKRTASFSTIRHHNEAKACAKIDNIYSIS